MTGRLPDHIPPRPRLVDHGMTKTALVLLVALLALPGWHIYQAFDAVVPPSGEEVHEAYVEDIGAVGKHRAPSRRGTDWLVVSFTDPEGEPGWAMYENRWIGKADVGDRITIYRDPALRTDEGQWRVMSERAIGGTAGWVAFELGLLVMIYGWFRVRRRARGHDDLAQE